jgi:hypothetical protein
MTQATATKTDALRELERLERIWQEAAARAKDLGREHFDARKRLFGHLDERGLLYERGHRMEREPDEYHPDGSPRRKDSAAGRLQAEIDKVPDPAVLAQEVEHARRLERNAKQAVDEHVAEHLDEILDGLRAEAEALAARVNAGLRESLPELDSYIGFVGRVSTLVAVAGREPRTIRGLDEAADLRRTLEHAELPAPIREDA